MRFCSIHSNDDKKCIMGYSRHHIVSMCNSGLRYPRSQLFACLVALSCHVVADGFAEAATIKLDHDTTINASNSFPEPVDRDEWLIVDIVDGVAGATNVDLVDGGVVGGFVNVREKSILNMTRGQIQAHTRIVDDATLNLNGGTILGVAAFYPYVDAIGILSVEDRGTINLSGGQFAGELVQDDSSVINVFGRSFIVDGQPVSETGSTSGRRIQGIYADGNPINITISRDGTSSQVFLHTIPESRSIVFVATCAIFLSAYRRRLDSHNS